MNNDWYGLRILIISVGVFFTLAIIGVIVEKILGYDEYKPIEYRV